MIQASILFVLLVAGSIGVQAGQFGEQLGGHIEECTESKFDGPLGRTFPKKYGLLLSVEEPNHAELLLLNVNVDDAQGKKEEPKDVIVLHMDPTVNVESLVVMKKSTGWPFINLPLSIENVCQISAKQLLVVKFEKEIEDNSALEMVFVLKTPIRSDKFGIHKEGDVIEASFALKEARLSIPCFDDDKYETSIAAEIAIEGKYTVSSETSEIEIQTEVLGRNLVQFREMKRLSEFSFKLTPAQ